MSAGPIDVSFAKNYSKISGIIWVGYPGQAGGDAIAQVIFGDYNPGGRLLSTWYPQDYVTKVPMTDMNMRPNASTGYPGRTYRFYTGETVYPFGYGLSYTNFNLSLVSAPKVLSVYSLKPTKHLISPSAGPSDSLDKRQAREIEVANTDCKGRGFNLVVQVENTGDRTGSHVFLLFTKSPALSVAAGIPRKQLIGFHRAEVRAGESQRVQLSVDLCRDLSVVDSNGVRKLVMGMHTLSIGSSTDDGNNNNKALLIEHRLSLQLSTSADQNDELR